MSYGIQVVMDNGKTFDLSAFSCNTYDLFTYTTGTGTYVKSYPELVGFNIYAMSQRLSNNSADACAAATVSYPSGIPTVTCTTILPPNSPGITSGGYPVANIYVLVN